MAGRVLRLLARCPSLKHRAMDCWACLYPFGIRWVDTILLSHFYNLIYTWQCARVISLSTTGDLHHSAID